MKTTKINKPTTPLAEEEQKREALEAIFVKAVTSAGEFLKPFDTLKYRQSVQLDHEKLKTNDTLISEFLCFHFNLTLGKNKNGYHLIYFNYDEEAISKFGTRVFNQMIRLLVTISAKEVTTINVEERIRFATEPSDVHNFLWKRLIDGEKEHIVISATEGKAN
jgi:hypothetical protein